VLLDTLYRAWKFQLEICPYLVYDVLRTERESYEVALTLDAATRAKGLRSLRLVIGARCFVSEYMHFLHGNF
jgi:hypothetical protein